MLNNFLITSTESSCRAERARKRADDHVYFCSVDVLRFGDAAAGATEDAVGPGFVEDKTEFILEFEFDLEKRLANSSTLVISMDTRWTYDLWQVYHIPNVLKQTLGDDEASGERLLGLLLDNLLEDVLQVFHIIVFEPPDSTATDLYALARSEVERLVRYDNISSLAETGNHTAYGREGLRVDDAGGDTEVCSDVGFGLHVNILCAVETRGTTRADTVCAQGLNGLVFENIVGEEVVEVVRGKVRDGAAIGELRLGAGRSARCSLALVRNTEEGICYTQQ